VYNNSFEVKKIILIIIKVPGTTFINIVPSTALKYLKISFMYYGFALLAISYNYQYTIYKIIELGYNDINLIKRRR
jgi:hypothetical protein